MVVWHPIPKEKAKRVAVIVTEYRFNSHADVILGRLLGDHEYKPQVEVAAIYTDQVPENDMSREAAARCQIPIYATIEEAIRAPYADGGLDGVIIIGEHGDYPEDELGRKWYPRRRFLEEVLLALDDLQLKVPIFSDKHLSYNIADTVWMYEQLQKRNLPFMGGSSIPHTPQVPAFDRKLLEETDEILVVSFSDVMEAYGYHALELLQSLAETRAGGEMGVRAVQALRGAQIWAALARKEWPEDLLTHAYACYDKAEVYPKSMKDTAVLFIVEYANGTKGYVLQQEDWINQWGFAFRHKSGESGEITSAMCVGDLERPFRHFETLTSMIENFIITGIEPFPAKRILLSSGLINYIMEALHQNQKLETPELLFDK
ncbi:hypothetical protein [Paenibacillus eucommiae]|uniref:Uncharacterized protein n=1 Tax=Paenibacillus eucommiae TaxID=1355755 RepID=A0ABS4ILX7_9BACL|nr:hypothetical protein [Paenibacillus eucommiae]MBP1988520.1 hypothetical protein [Paenibacillus eucommiae]